MQVRGAWVQIQVHARGTGTSIGTAVHVQVRGKGIQLQVSFVLPRVPSVSTLVRLLCTLNACTLGTRGNTKEGTRYMYRYPYEVHVRV